GADGGRQVGAVVPEDAGRAARRLQQAEEHADGGGLAGAVSANEREDAAARHTQRESVHGTLAAEVARQPARLDDGLAVVWARRDHVEPPCLAPQSSAFSFSSMT